MGAAGWFVVARRPLNESPSEKEGKSGTHLPNSENLGSLNESPSEKEGKYPLLLRHPSRLSLPQ